LLFTSPLKQPDVLLFNNIIRYDHFSYTFLRQQYTVNEVYNTITRHNVRSSDIRCSAAISVATPYARSYPAAYVAAIAVPTAVLIFVARWKSNAPWRWRWGEFKDGDED